MSGGHLLLLDASGFAHQAFHGAAPIFRSDGLPTYAVIGFLKLTFDMLGRAEADPPTHGAAIFDYPGKTFRHGLFTAYKAHRRSAEALAKRAELDAQLPLMREAARVMGLESLEREGYEADDVLATLAARATKAGIRTTIVSGDKDLHQCVRDDWVEIIEPRNRRRILEADVVAKFGVPPSLVVDVQALCGDAVDGIPGVPGIGMQTAAGLIRAHDNLRGLLKYIDNGSPFRGRPQLTASLRRERANIPLYKKLATLKTDVPLDVEFEALLVKPILRHHLDAMLNALEAGPVQRAMFSAERTIFRLVPKLKPDADPLAWHGVALKGKKRGTIPDLPQCGWYKRRLVRGGPWVAARIWRDPETDFATGKPTPRDILMCMVGGERRDVLSEWMKLCTQPIKEEDYNHMIAVAEWAKNHSPSSPESAPTRKIDWNTIEL